MSNKQEKFRECVGKFVECVYNIAKYFVEGREKEALYEAKRCGKNRYVFSKEKENTI